MKRSVFRVLVLSALCMLTCLPTLAARLLVPVGEVVGLRLEDGSVTVAAFDEVLGAAAREAGVQVGDVILSVDGAPVASARDLKEALQRSDGTVCLTVRRGEDQKQLRLCPAVSGEGPKLGVYVREGVSGIGTVTYYDPDSGTFGALGHGITTADAAAREGSLLPATVLSVRKGLVGKPGQLKGAVEADPIGTLRRNCALGVFGSCRPFAGEALPTGQAKPGQASILSNVEGDSVEAFSVEILRLYHRQEKTGRDLLLRVTDEKLLNTTGGIVAGMSGSPIIQDGKLVGAVTHVLVNDPTTGYGIFIENMLDAAA